MSQATKRTERGSIERKAPGADVSLDKRVSRMSPVKAYLLAYNVLSCLLWAQVFILTIAYLVSPHPSAPTSQSFLSPLTRFFRADPTSQTPKLVQNAIDHLRGSYHFLGLGTLVKWTQTLAVLDVAHAATGLVKSNVGTAASQVFSRLWAVWAVVEMVPESKDHSLYTTMILAWSITEIVRYGFYASALLGIDVPILTWARYNLFIILYPIGASSEAFLSLSTLPPLSTLNFQNVLSSPNPISALVKHVVKSLPLSMKAKLMKTSIGKHALWKMAKATVTKKTKDYWGFIEVARLILFFIWWPALAVLMSHMFKLRRKVMRKGTVVGTKKTN